MATEWAIEGKTFLITGGASGLGAGYAEAFLRLGAQKVAILDVADKVGKDYTETLNKTYENKVIFVKCDISKEEEIEKAFDEVLTAFERIDVIINNAGIMNDALDKWRNASDVNWQGLVSFTLKGIKHMRKDEGGSGGTIINTSSVAGFAKNGALPMYSGSKAAVMHFGRCLASPEFNSETGVRILTIAFGATTTALLDDFLSKTFDDISKKAVANLTVIEQSISSAVAAMVKMYQEGESGSFWLSLYDKVGQDITSTIDAAYEPLIKLLYPQNLSQ